jgi:hypothetical protein
VKRRLVCDLCHNLPDAPMLKDSVWVEIASKRTLLCLDCTERLLGRSITLDDLNDSLWSIIIKRLVERAKVGLI